MSNVHKKKHEQIGMTKIYNCYYHKICKDGKFRCTDNINIMDCIHVKNKNYNILGAEKIKGLNK